jgi:cytosine/adenosine deaminase-related metal-dependent hydrolase
MRLWIRNPLGIVAEAAAGGVVVEGAVIAELVAAGAAPAAPVDEVFDASAHVVLPGLINTHHHFYQTLTRAHPAAIDRELFPWLTALYPLWARLTPEDLRLAVRAALRGCCFRAAPRRPTITTSIRRGWRMPSTSQSKRRARSASARRSRAAR